MLGQQEPDANKAHKDRVSMAIAILALFVSSLSLYFSTFWGPDNLRVIINKPDIRVRGSHLDFLGPNSFFETPEDEADDSPAIPTGEAASFRMSFRMSMSFVNSGHNPLLISQVRHLFLDHDADKGCQYLNGSGRINASSYFYGIWNNEPFVIDKAQIKIVEIKFDDLFYAPPLSLSDRFTTCFEFTIADTSGKVDKIITPGMSISKDMGSNEFIESRDIQSEPSAQVSYSLIKSWF